MYNGIPLGLVFLNFIGMVLLVMAVVVGIKLIIRGARGHPGRGFGGRGYGRRGQGRHGPAFGWHGAGDWADDGGHGGRRPGKHGGRRGARHERRDQALDHANLRLARGEISTAQYLELRAALMRPAGSGSGSEGARADGSRDHGAGRRGGSASAIARLRLASGEISVDEFTALRSALEA